MGDLPRVCVVGGGPAGMAMARNLLAHRIPFDAYERHGDLGGLWDPANPGSPIYDSAHFISSKSQSHYHDFPMPEHYPDYPSNAQILAYLRSFADAYGLRDHIRLGTGVRHAQRTMDGWQVTLDTGEERDYGALVCANGTNWHPVMPEYPGEFTGEIRHSVTYRSPEEFRGRRVLVIGAGNSGCDIACDAATHADAAFISLRRGYHFIPKYVMGVPADEFAESGPHLPLWLEQRVFGGMLRVINGDLTRLGLQKPDHRVFESHPIMNTQVLHHLGHGDITAKRDVARFEGRRVHFVDGSVEEIDLVLCATGYEWQIPYVDADAFAWKDGRPDLYLSLMSRTDPTLYALGFMETNGGAYKVFDQMADVISRAIVARAAGDPQAQRLAELVASDHTDLGGGIHFVPSPRHATYVESGTYRRHLAEVRRRMGWPGLSPGCFDRLRVGAAA